MFSGELKKKFAAVGVVFGLVALLALGLLKIWFPIDPPETALTLFRLAVISMLVSVVLLVGAIPARRVWIGVVVVIIDLLVLVFGWPFYAVF